MQIKSAGLGKFLAEWAKWGVGRGWGVPRERERERERERIKRRHPMSVVIPAKAGIQAYGVWALRAWANHRFRHSSGSWNPFCFCSERTKQQRSAVRQPSFAGTAPLPLPGPNA
ncbi:hypothetical protein ACFW0P_12000 [Lysobacter soli]|uniref:hypothetical protein n=1 Tax=Lysobacter soli TaxID=453783 RepID=UPI0036787570